MAWTWTNTNAQGDLITPAWGTEIKNAIARLMADVYTTPVNDGTATAKLAAPLQGFLPLKVGRLTSNGAIPVTATVSVPTALASDYVVIPAWQAAYNVNDGEIRVTTSIENGTMTMSFTNSGTNTGQIFGYAVYKAG